MKQELFDNIKNIPGWKTKRKIIVFSVDDYGNVRVDSKKAREKMDKAGLKIYNRFDAFDSLETREDLEMLYEVLISVKDKNLNPAVFTPYALSCNIDFEKIESEGFNQYHYEKLTDTYKKLEEIHSNAYKGAWQLWQEGVTQGIMAPQFHGREHLNLKVFLEKLKAKDRELIAVLKNRSYTSLSDSNYSTISYTEAFSFDKGPDIDSFQEILKTGTDLFEDVYGARSRVFTPPAMQFPNVMEKNLSDYGLFWMDKPFHRKSHVGNGVYKKEFNFTRKKSARKINTLVRNVVFEPSSGQTDHVKKAMKQIEAAFRWNKPANISSHRVNFCGNISEKNREKGLTDLKSLLKNIIQTWPDVEFMSVDHLVKIIENAN